MGLRAADLAEAVDTAFNGEAVSQVLENQRTYDVIVRFDHSSVETIASSLLDTPAGPKVPISQIAKRAAPHHRSGQRALPAGDRAGVDRARRRTIVSESGMCAISLQAHSRSPDQTSSQTELAEAPGLDNYDLAGSPSD